MKPTIALFVYDPKCSVQSGNGIIKALQTDYNFKTVPFELMQRLSKVPKAKAHAFLNRLAERQRGISL